MIFGLALVSLVLIFFIGRSIYGSEHAGELEEVNKHIEQVLAEFKKKPIKDLQELQSNSQKEARTFGRLKFTITVWARKHDKEDKLGVVVEYWKQHPLGVATVGAVGFFVSPTGVKDMAEEDLWDYGY